MGQLLQGKTEEEEAIERQRGIRSIKNNSWKKDLKKSWNC